MASAIRKDNALETRQLIDKMLQHVNDLSTNEGLYAEKEPVYQEMQSIIKMLKSACPAFKMQAFQSRMERITLLIVEHSKLSCDPNKDPSFMRLYTIQMLGEQCLGLYNNKAIQQIEQIAKRLGPFLKQISLPKTYYIKSTDEEIGNLVKKVLIMKAALEKESMSLPVKTGFFYFSMNCVRKHLKNFQPIPWGAIERLTELTQIIFANVRSTITFQRQEELLSGYFHDNLNPTSGSFEYPHLSLSPLPPPSPESHSTSSSSSLEIPGCVSSPFSLESQTDSAPSSKSKKRKRVKSSVPISSSSSAFRPFNLSLDSRTLGGKLPQLSFLETIDSEVGGRH